MGAAIIFMQGTQVKNCFYYSIGFCHTSVTPLKGAFATRYLHNLCSKNVNLGISRMRALLVSHFVYFF
ncbi:hypothetical protein BM524_01065 [Alteromonas mediterranea]|uniref:Uncharacterized protein n=1 Tax=Alteromonas mediterranea TaxID=314275 RepID=A0AAC9J7B0_9ALTE|nr:hypothetical protein BM524_01065 [Alteromonas mediterranea]